MTLKEKLAKINTPKVRTLQDGRVSSVEELWDRVVLPYLPDRETMLKWNKLLMDYADSEMPTFAIRAYYSAPREEYGTLRRGFLTSTPHYKFFYTDNYFAAYFLKMSMDGYVPSLEEFKEMMDDRTFPLRFGPITTPEKEMMSFKQGNDPGIHKAGFKVAHIIPVGMDYDTGAEVVNLTEIMNRYFPRGEREDYLMKAGDGEDHYERYLDADADAKRMIIAHFMRFVHPMNYFACPNDRNVVSNNCKRLAEYQPLLDYAHDYLYDIYGDAYVEFAKRAMALPKYRTSHIGSGDNAIDVTYGLNINGAETKFINDIIVGSPVIPEPPKPKEPSVGSMVRHEKYGIGILKSIIDGRACVQFEGEEGVKVFQYPQCFEQGYLKIVSTSGLPKPVPKPAPTPAPTPGSKWQTFYYINCPGCGSKIGKISAGTEFTTTCARCAKKLAIEVNESSVTIKVM